MAKYLFWVRNNGRWWFFLVLALSSGGQFSSGRWEGVRLSWGNMSSAGFISHSVEPPQTKGLVAATVVILDKKPGEQWDGLSTGGQGLIPLYCRSIYNMQRVFLMGHWTRPVSLIFRGQIVFLFKYVVQVRLQDNKQSVLQPFSDVAVKPVLKCWCILL